MGDFEPTEFRTNVLGLVKTAAYFNAPSVLTTSFDTGPNGPIVQEIVDALPNAPLIRRPGQVNAMDNEDFVKAVKATGKKQVIVRYQTNPLDPLQDGIDPNDRVVVFSPKSASHSRR